MNKYFKSNKLSAELRTQDKFLKEKVKRRKNKQENNIFFQDFSLTNRTC